MKKEDDLEAKAVSYKYKGRTRASLLRWPKIVGLSFQPNLVAVGFVGLCCHASVGICRESKCLPVHVLQLTQQLRSTSSITGSNVKAMFVKNVKCDLIDVLGSRVSLFLMFNFLMLSMTQVLQKVYMNHNDLRSVDSAVTTYYSRTDEP